MKLLVTNIQRFSLHDGPGIRTTVFLKGCSLHCPWCCNPENIIPYKQYYFQKKKCIAKNGLCVYGECPFTKCEDIKDGLARVTELQFYQCKSGAIGEYGKWYDTDELVEEIMKDAVFWGKCGGITFSGGEPLLQIDCLVDVLKKLKNRGTNLCVETSLYVSTEKMRKAIKYFDEMYVDIKLLDKSKCREVLGGDVNVYYENLNALYESGMKIHFRHPQIKGYTDDAETERQIKELLMKYPGTSYRIIPEHHLGNQKRQTLGE